MSNRWPSAPLVQILKPVERPEVPVAGNVYRQVGVKLWGVGAYEREAIDGAETRYKTLSRVEADDVIVNKIWARNGSVAVIPESLAGSYVSGEFPTFTSIRDQLEPRWFHWITKTRFFWDQCDAKSRGTSGKNRIRPERFLEIDIPLPPLPEQRRIVVRIEELAAKINEARGLRQQVTETEIPALCNAIIPRVFDGKWPYVSLEQVCSLITDGTHQTPRYVDDGFMFLSAQNVKPFRFIPEVHRKVSADDYHTCVARAKPQKGDVLMTRVGAMIGEAAVIDRDLDFAFYVSLAILRPRTEKIISEFLAHWLNSARGLAQSRRQTLGKGHSQGNLNLKLY